MAKLLIIIGIALLLAGVILHFYPNALSWLGRLPGDIRIGGEKGGFYFPLTTMILISIVVSVLIQLLQK